MLKKSDIDRIAQAVARATLDSSAGVESTSTIDSQGDPALKITIVLTPGSTESIQGKDVLKTLDQVQQRLQEEGEERFPIIEFETKGEAPVGD
jgi:hypothetical protein